MQRFENIREELAAEKSRLETEYQVSKLGIFGSYVRDEQTEDSDLDILVEFDEPISLLDLVRLENELSEYLGLEVDLVTKTSLKPRIQSHVDSHVVYV